MPFPAKAYAVVVGSDSIGPLSGSFGGPSVMCSGGPAITFFINRAHF
jgi:hypothetical protein